MNLNKIIGNMGRAFGVTSSRFSHSKRRSSARMCVCDMCHEDVLYRDLTNIRSATEDGSVIRQVCSICLDKIDEEVERERQEAMRQAEIGKAETETAENR